jgi:tape measure domain-containing protein
MAVAGTLTYSTKLDTSGLQSGVSSVKNIVSALGIDKIISTAMSTISDSVDNAISRLDTLNNYSKVMANLGISSEDSEASINKLSKGLKGIPTTLNDAVLSVQRFTSANSNVSKSTDYFLALNNALLAGGASTEIQASALEQLSQAYAKGTPDAVEWRSILTAMPAQLKQVANYLGYTSTAVSGDFYNAIQDGTLSMDDFMDAIVTLNEEGTGEFLSFAEQAKNATGGISTNVTNAKTAVARGVANIIDSIDQALSDAGFGGLGQVIANVGSKGEEALNKIADVIGKIDWQEVIDKVKELWQKIKDLEPAIVAVGVAVAGWKLGTTIQGVVVDFQKAQVQLSLFSLQAGETTIAQGLLNGTLSVGEGIVALLTGKMTLAELASAGLAKAQAVLNAVMAANPIALIVLAIVALIAIFVVLWNKCDWFREFWIGLWDGIKSVFETVWNAIGTFFTETIPEWINGVIEWFKNLPYNIGLAIGEIIGTIVKLGIELWNWVTTDLPEIISNVIEWFKSLPSKIWEFLSQIPGKVKTMATNMISTAKTEIPKFINTFVNYIKELPNKMLDIGKNIVKGIWNGIKNVKSWLLDKIKSFASGITDGIKKALGIASPSKVMRDQVGQWIPKGIAVGIDANTDEIMKSVDNMNDEMITKMQRAVQLETGNINASASLKSAVANNQIIQVNANLTADVEMDSNKVGRIITPVVSKTLKTAGVK